MAVAGVASVVVAAAAAAVAVAAVVVAAAAGVAAAAVVAAVAAAVAAAVVVVNAASAGKHALTQAGRVSTSRPARSFTLASGAGRSVDALEAVSVSTAGLADPKAGVCTTSVRPQR